MSTYQLPSLSDDEAAGFAQSISGEGSFQMSPNPSTGGYQVDTDSSSIASMIAGAFGNMESSNQQETTSTDDPFLDALQGVWGADVGVGKSDSGSGSTAGTAAENPNDKPTGIWAEILSWFTTESANILAIVVGLVFMGLGALAIVESGKA